ncbi:Divalent metal cation transporter MntH [Pirellulimonas nuda]|uniref:Divalent metal cation transporter MntH n=1 Tax=Pirellulimonas nuda TaxID=2528009 RepID=A0A518DDY5_9BACT|nr:divalent metal cation transporter [Pirellulimonas nuda]QDU89689.1 Divalent metal cation transporter MntH [Pirellulimonas nuda]
MRLPNALLKFGPAIIIVSIVLGPGSVLSSSKVGCQYGYQFLWVIAAATLLMMGMSTLGTLVGVSVQATPCEEVARRFGRPASVLVGVTLFLVVACFQASNNIAVLASLEGLTGSVADAPARGSGSGVASVAILAAMNLLIVAALYGFKQTYRWLERFMGALVLTMVVGFVINLVLAQPSIAGMLRGLIPSLPQGRGESLLPRLSDGEVVDPFWGVQALIATTLSVAAAFFQPYLVREKKWTSQDARAGVGDALRGIALLGATTAVVMATSAAALHGKLAPEALRSAGDVARQLEPLFGEYAAALFSLGIFCAAFSSFLGNALIGGVVLSDSLGWGASFDGRAPKLLTCLALAAGMAAAMASTVTTFSVVQLVVLAQALTVLGGPLLAFVLLWLATKLSGRGRLATIPFALVVTLVSIGLAVRTAWRLYLQSGL